MNEWTFGDRVIEAVLRTGNCAVMGLDPHLPSFPPEAFKDSGVTRPRSLDEAGEFVLEINRCLIHAVHGLIPAVKLQSAYYEALGIPGLVALRESIREARASGLITIVDAKRADIGSTAEAYADPLLGTTDVGGGEAFPVFDADAITVVPYLGSDGLKPFIDRCHQGKGIFIVLRSSNPSATEVQDVETGHGTVAEIVAGIIRRLDLDLPSEHGFGPIGVVLGAQAGPLGLKLRESLPRSLVLVPGYGAQGGTAVDAFQYARETGLGIVVNSSRGLLYGSGANPQGYVASVMDRVRAMTKEFALPKSSR